MLSEAAATTVPQVDASGRQAFARVEVHTRADSILAEWAELEQVAPCSIYQTKAWLLPWVETIGKSRGLTPLYALARDERGRQVALLPLGLRHNGRLRIATWLGGNDANLNMGLMRPDVVCSAHDLQRLLRQIARASPAPIDLFFLKNQPNHWGGRANPFALLPRVAAPSAVYGTALGPSGEAFLDRKLSKDTRKKLRKKEARLAELGPLAHCVASDRSAQQRILEIFLKQKTSRLRALNIKSGFEEPEMRAFIEAASAPAGHGIELHALSVGERIVAVYGGAAHAGHWSGMFNAFDQDPQIARSSPGDILLTRLIARCCDNGLIHFDLGIGEARYKAAFCDDKIELFDLILPVTLAGRATAHLLALRQKLKRYVKSRPPFLKLARSIRATLERLSP